MQVHSISRATTAAFHLGILVGFLTAAGCSGPTSDDKRDDPALKSSMEKSMELYKSKTQAKKGSRPPSKPRA